MFPLPSPSLKSPMREHEPDITLGRYDADDWARLNGKGKALRMRLKASLIERAKTCLLYTSPSPRD